MATNDFRIASFPMKADGTPDLANVVFDPPQERWNVPDARVVVKGAATLDGEWKAVEGATAAEKAAMRFFKVVVGAVGARLARRARPTGGKRQVRPLPQRVRRGRVWPVVQNAVPSRMNSGRFACMMPLRCWMGSLRVRTYFG